MSRIEKLIYCIVQIYLYSLESLYPCGLAASANVYLMATETEISAAPWALQAQEGLYFCYTTNC